MIVGYFIMNEFLEKLKVCELCGTQLACKRMSGIPEPEELYLITDIDTNGCRCDHFEFEFSTTSNTITYYAISIFSEDVNYHIYADNRIEVKTILSTYVAHERSKVSCKLVTFMPLDHNKSLWEQIDNNLNRLLKLSTFN